MRGKPALPFDGRHRAGTSLHHALLNNAFGVLFTQLAMLKLVSDGVVGSLLVFLIDGAYLGIFERDGAYGTFDGLSALHIPVLRALLPGWQIYLAPVVFLFWFGWLYGCVRLGRFSLNLSAQHRRHCIRATYAVPFLLLIVAIKTLPTTFLFDAAIHGYHPLSPTLRCLCAIIVPLTFWRWIDRSSVPHT